jgi:hypothetical protein
VGGGGARRRGLGEPLTPVLDLRSGLGHPRWERALWDSPWPYEEEVTVSHEIAPGDIRAVTLVNEGVSYFNPNWVP